MTGHAHGEGKREGKKVLKQEQSQRTIEDGAKNKAISDAEKEERKNLKGSTDLATQDKEEKRSQPKVQKEAPPSYAQVLEPSKKKIKGEEVFQVFENEILVRTPKNKEGKGGFCPLPDGTKVYLGYEDDNGLTTYNGPPGVLSETQVKGLVTKQSWFFDNHVTNGYFFDVRSLRDVLGDSDTIKVANFEKVLFTLYKGKRDNLVYRTDSNGLLAWYAGELKDPFLRVIIPGYATAFMDVKTDVTDQTAHIQYDTTEYKAISTGLNDLLILLDRSNPSDVWSFDSLGYQQKFKAYDFPIRKHLLTAIISDGSQNRFLIDRKSNQVEMNDSLDGVYPILFDENNQIIISNGDVSLVRIRGLQKYQEYIPYGVSILIVVVILLGAWLRIRKLRRRAKSKEVTAFHEIQDGETLDDILELYKLMPKQLLELNKFGSDVESFTPLNELNLGNYLIYPKTETVELPPPDLQNDGHKGKADLAGFNEGLNKLSKSFDESLRQMTKEIGDQNNKRQEDILNQLNKLQETLNASEDEKVQNLQNSLDQVKRQYERVIVEKAELLSKNTSQEGVIEELRGAKKSFQAQQKHAEFLEEHKGIADDLHITFKLLLDVENDVLEVVKKETDPFIQNFASLVSGKYLMSPDKALFFRWYQVIITMMRSDGLLVDRWVRDKLKNKNSSQEKLEHMKWLMENEVLPQRVGALLTWLEELGNADKISRGKSLHLAQSAQNYKKELMNAIQNRHKAEIQDIALFAKPKEYRNIKSVHTQTVYDTSSLSTGFNDILEIKTYGVKVSDKNIETLVVVSD